MSSELDRRFDETLAEVTGPGGRLVIAADEEERAIVENFPATLPSLFRTFCELNGEAEAVPATAAVAEPDAEAPLSGYSVRGNDCDDTRGLTLVGLSTLGASVKDDGAELSKSERGRLAGKLLAQRALEQGITKVVFDRGGYLYHGRVKAFAEGAREGGLDF